MKVAIASNGKGTSPAEKGICIRICIRAATREALNRNADTN